MRKKTFKSWEKSNINLDEFLTEPCEIDERLSNYLGECTCPKYCSPKFTQSGEPEYHDDGISFHMTVSRINNKYFYLGILPEFKE